MLDTESSKHRYEIFYWDVSKINSSYPWTLLDSPRLESLREVNIQIQNLKQQGCQFVKVFRSEGERTQEVQISLKTDLEVLGRLVRSAWIEWASEQKNPPPQWLEDWETIQVTQPQQVEVDMRIAMAVLEKIQS